MSLGLGISRGSSTGPRACAMTSSVQGPDVLIRARTFATRKTGVVWALVAGGIGRFDGVVCRCAGDQAFEGIYTHLHTLC